MLAILGQNPKCIYYNTYVYYNGYIIYFNDMCLMLGVLFVFLHANAFSEGPWPPKGGHRNTSQYPMKDAKIHGLF